MHSPPFTYGVLGTRVGKAIAHFLASLPDTAQVYITDIGRTEARAAAYDINTALRYTDKKCVGVDFDATKDSVQDFLANFPEISVIVSATSTSFSFKLAEAAIESQRHFLDLGGVVEVTKNLMSLDQAAKTANVSVIPDNGLMPGTGLVFMRLLLYLFDSAKNIWVTVGGVPQRPVPPLFYALPFAMEGLRHLCCDQAPILERGAIRLADPFSYAGEIQIPELKPFHNKGWVEAFITAGTSIAPWTMQTLGVQNFWKRTIRWPGFIKGVKDISPKNFEKEIKPLLMPDISAENPDIVWMKVEAQIAKNGNLAARASFTLFDLFDHDTGLSAMRRTTGFSAGIMAHLAALGKTKTGVATPDLALTLKNIGEYMEELQKHFSITWKYQNLE
ncbi:MAG: saccharopine dehydrogenase NADP-binding domain-containing protein [Candidatus Sungbacteria bacterium]|nr:saccharopine dehydrogenase NADP-binding domain-containing protein [Candidatus Sungbacteria bacterium]